ncbi:hypothetical protein MD484_g6455, partial [Candolleomyces efflorescens]
MDSADTPGVRSCSVEEYQRSRSGDPSVHCLSRGQSVGLTVVIISAFVSFVAVLYVFGIIITGNIIRQRRRSRVWQIFGDPVDVIMVRSLSIYFSIFLGEAIQALGELLNIKWVNDGKVKIGAFCTTQGVFKQLGQIPVSLSILLLAIYTFRGLWIGVKSESLLVTKLLVAGIWILVTFMIVLGNALNLNKDEQHRYMTPVPYWCWIGKDYLQWRIWGLYFWFWLTLTISILVYIPLFFWHLGKIIPVPRSWWRFKIRRVNSGVGDDFPTELRNQAKIMLAYPVVFCITVLPLSIVRWISFRQESDGGGATIPSAATFATISLLVLSGVFNVTLLLTTRPNTLLFGKHEDDDPQRMDSLPLGVRDRSTQ